MFEFIFELLADMFALFYDFMQKVKVYGNVSFWNMLFTFIVGGAILNILINNIGGSALGGSTASTIKKSKNEKAQRVNVNEKVSQAVMKF